LKIAMQSKDIHIRQVIAETMTTIPKDFKLQYESLLEDKSYNTREIALTKLCKQFPNEVTNYLNLSKDWVGFNNKNLRIIWLSIALKNPNYEAAKQTDFKNELITYSSTNYDSYIRQNALEILLAIFPENENVLISLINATTHHKWQFVKFGKDSLRILIKNEKFRKIFQNLIPKLSEKEAIILNNLLKE
jgi:aminopeptidase N